MDEKQLAIETSLDIPPDEYLTDRQKVCARELLEQELQLKQKEIEALFNRLGEYCELWFSQVQGFSRDNFDGDCMLVTTELAEAVEAHRKSPPDMGHVAEELADVMIRLLHLAGKYRIPMAEAFVPKMLKNLERPFRHGKGY